MPRYLISGVTLELPAMQIARVSSSCEDAWRGGYLTVRLTQSVEAIRVHTNGREYKTRPASSEYRPGRPLWFAFDDATLIGTSRQLTKALSLPTRENAPSFFTHTSLVMLQSGSILNIGIASPLFGAETGGGAQGELVGGPPPIIKPLLGKFWHSQAGNG